MVPAPAYSATSFTKNFGWEADYQPLQVAVRSGFGGRVVPTPVKTWRANSGVPDADRELVPLRFFLHTQPGPNGDYVMPDEFVRRCVQGGYDADLARLALFAFHLASSGRWHRSKWPGGRLVGWARDYVCQTAWREGLWHREAFADVALENYIQASIRGGRDTRHKVFTNYRHMLRNAGVIAPDLQTGSVPFHSSDWAEQACKLMWDRAVYSSDLDEMSDEQDLVDFFVNNEGYKLLGTSRSRTHDRSYCSCCVSQDGGVARFASLPTPNPASECTARSR